MFDDGRSRALSSLRELKRMSARKIRYTEKFLTLTLKHSGDPRRDVQALPDLWAWLCRKLRVFFAVQMNVLPKDVPWWWVRVIEATPGKRGEGHAHVHAWLLSPYVHHEFIRAWWGRALLAREYGVPMRPLDDVLRDEDDPRRRAQLREHLERDGEDVPWPVIHLEASQRGVERELIKYLVKDAEWSSEGRLQFMDPGVFAGIYTGFEGVRAIQASRRFWCREAARTGICHCNECGSVNLVTKSHRVNGP